MLFSWLKKRSRRRLAKAGLSDELRALLPAAVWQYERLTEDEQRRLEASAAVFLHEKNWEGCGGLPMSDEIRLTIAAQMALFTLGLPGEYFDRVLSVLVYPDAYRVPDEHAAGGMVVGGESTRLGEAWHRGPVVLSWKQVKRAGESRYGGRSLVAHEFAHQLDMLNGRHADGVPPMPDNQSAEHWIETLDAALARLRRDCRRRMDPLMDCYGATDRSEFLAVASEVFFQWPARMAEREPELLAALRGYYRQDPLRWDET
ncbi:Protein MtfA [Posidoniimonas polymericola]|uniref:Protein MtfA n=1 Tax=Posidoniimonas polymericola TaxID=2528002 RepID=A0A5C5YQU9_9BACT|nr:M90 family metallopeptidase [Posidoniimonas polymericola]TWT77314.1 Protein MtfA [Posidoniimonas polymericola]